jgi:hypothetical protein
MKYVMIYEETLLGNAHVTWPIIIRTLTNIHDVISAYIRIDVSAPYKSVQLTYLQNGSRNI